MKEKDAIVNGGHRLVLYVEKEDASYGPVQTGSFMTEKYLGDFLEKKRRLRQELRGRLEDGLISPVGYYMQLLDIAQPDLAKRVKISRRKLRSHLTPKGFARMSLHQAQRYADVFGIPVANLFQVIIEDDEEIQVSHERTRQPLVVTTHVRKGEK